MARWNNMIFSVHENCCKIKVVMQASAFLSFSLLSLPPLWLSKNNWSDRRAPLLLDILL